MSTWYQLRAFVMWMLRKTLRLPLMFISKVRELMRVLASTMYRNPGEGVFIVIMSSIMLALVGFMVGLVCGVSMFDGDHQRIAMFSLQFAVGLVLVFLITVFFNSCWYAFTLEQAKLFEHLKDGYDRTT